MTRKVKLVELANLYEALKKKGYEVDEMVISVSGFDDGHYYEDSVWGFQVVGEEQVILEV